MDGLIFLIICCLIIFTNIINSIFTFKLRYGKNYLLHLIVPTLITSIGYIIGICTLNFSGASYEIYCDVLIFMLVIISIVFSIFQSLLIIVKYILDKEYTYLTLVLIYLFLSILAPAANIICTHIAFIVFLVIEIVYKKKPIRYKAYN